MKNLEQVYREMEDDLLGLERELWRLAGVDDLTQVQVIETDDFFDRALSIIEDQAFGETVDPEGTVYADKVRNLVPAHGIYYMGAEEGAMLFKDGQPLAHFSFSSRGATVAFGTVIPSRKCYRSQGRIGNMRPWQEVK